MKRYILYFSCLFSLIMLSTCLHLREEKNLLRGQSKEPVDLQTLKKSSTYGDFASKLDSGLNGEKENQLYKELRAYFKSNQEKGGKMICKNETYDVNVLSPSQTDIGLIDSLAYVIMPIKDDEKYTNYFDEEPKEVGSRIITYNGKWVVDGHHRWSQLYMVNPEGKIKAFNCEYYVGKNKVILDIMEVLKIFQAAIGAIAGKIGKTEAGNNIYALTEDEIAKEVNSLLEKIIVEKKITLKKGGEEKIINNDKLKEKIKFFVEEFNKKVDKIKQSSKKDKGKDKNKTEAQKKEEKEIPKIFESKLSIGKTDDDIKEALATQLIKSVNHFVSYTKSRRPSNASDRVLMPQTDFPISCKDCQSVTDPISGEDAKKPDAVINLLKNSSPKMK